MNKITKLYKYLTNKNLASKQTLFFLMLCPILGFSQWTSLGQTVGIQTGEELGTSVSLSSNGDFVAIGVSSSDTNGNNAGAARVYQISSGSFSQIGLDMLGEATGDKFGGAISISGSGNIVAVGTQSNDGNGAQAGHVRIFENIAGEWLQMGPDIDGESADDRFGYALKLSTDGSTLVVGARLNDDNGADAGHAKVYRYISGNWTQIGSNIDGENIGDQFGFSVSINGDGNIIAVGTPNNDVNGTNSGHVRVYQYISGNWMQIGANLDGLNAGDEFGYAIDLNYDGTILAVGAVRRDAGGFVDTGAVRVYQNMSNIWTQIGSAIIGEDHVDLCGSSVSLNDNGTIIAIGSSGHDWNGNLDSGKVRVFEYVAGNWTFPSQGFASGTANNHQVGQNVSIDATGYRYCFGIPTYGTSSEGRVNYYENSSLLSIHENNLIEVSYIHPNPTQKSFQISSNTSINKVEIVTINGQYVKTFNNISDLYNIEDLSNGLYIIKIYSEGNIISKKLIKQ